MLEQRVQSVFAGIFAARRTGRLSGLPRSALDAVFSLPLVLPPTVSGWLLLRLLGPRHWIGIWLENLFHLRLILTWQAAILPAFLAAFPIMYRVSRRTFDNFDGDLSDFKFTFDDVILYQDKEYVVINCLDEMIRVKLVEKNKEKEWEDITLDKKTNKKKMTISEKEKIKFWIETDNYQLKIKSLVDILSKK